MPDPDELKLYFDYKSPFAYLAHEDHVFGVPIFVFRGELFWGYDRMPLLEARLRECGLARAAATTGGAG